MDTVTALAHVATAIAIGLMVGLERERSARHDDPRPSAGARTFALIAVAGAVAAALGGAVAVAGLVAVTVLLVVGYVVGARAGTRGEPDLGATTEVAGIGTYLLGALAWTRPSWAVAVGVGVVVVLAAKRPLHHLARHLVTDQDVVDALRLFVVALVVLPLLPDRPLGPYGVLNPSRIWLLVVALTVVGWVGYLGVRALGERRGLLLVGFLGGFVSASATTLVLAHHRREGETTPAPAVMPAVLAANVATLVQLVVVVGVAAPQVALPLLPAAGAGILVLGIEIAWLWRRRPAEPSPAESSPAEPPAEPSPADASGDRDPVAARPLSLRATVSLAAILVVLLLATRAAADLAGDRGVAVVALVGGLADAHAAAVAAASLAGPVIPVGAAVAAIGLALAANTATKLVLALAAGGRRFAGHLALLLAAPVTAVAAGIVAVP